MHQIHVAFSRKIKFPFIFYAKSAMMFALLIPLWILEILLYSFTAANDCLWKFSFKNFFLLQPHDQQDVCHYDTYYACCNDTLHISVKGFIWSGLCPAVNNRTQDSDETFKYFRDFKHPLIRAEPEPLFVCSSWRTVTTLWSWERRRPSSLWSALRVRIWTQGIEPSPSLCSGSSWGGKTSLHSPLTSLWSQLLVLIALICNVNV